jgi:nucleotide-binding universal stress UspA family protein
MTPTLEQPDATRPNVQRPPRPHPGDLANQAVHRFVHRAIRLCRPDIIYWCNGSAYEHSRLTMQAAREAALTQGSADPPTSEPAPAQETHFEFEFKDCMIGRTMYVIPFITNPTDTSPGNVGIAISDSLSVVLKMASETRIGDGALRALGPADQSFERILHSAAKGIIKHEYPSLAPVANALDAIEQSPQPFRQILVAVDHSKQAAWAFDLAARLVQANKSRLILMHVVFIPPLQPELAYIEPSDREDCFREAQQLLEDFKATLPCDVHVETVLREGDAATEIVKAAKTFAADLIVVGTHGRGAIGRVILGSVANAVVRRSACPVLTVAHAPPSDQEVVREASASASAATHP